MSCDANLKFSDCETGFFVVITNPPDLRNMNIGIGAAAAAAMGYFVYSSTSSSAVSLKGKTVLVTGAGSGVGRLTAIKFAQQGAHLVLWDLNEAGMKETQAMVFKAAPSVRCCCEVVDVSSTQAVYRAAKNANDWASPSYVSVLVNNAGIVSGKALLDTQDEKISKTFQVNVLAHFWTTKAFLPRMISEKFGHVVTVASIAGLTAAPKMVDYGTSLPLRLSLKHNTHIHTYIHVLTIFLCSCKQTWSRWFRLGTQKRTEANEMQRHDVTDLSCTYQNESIQGI